MTKEEVLKLARGCGAYPAANVDGALLFWSESQVVQFAALVAAAENEACAKVAEMTPCQFDDYKRIVEAIRARGNT